MLSCNPSSWVMVKTFAPASREICPVNSMYVSLTAIAAVPASRPAGLLSQLPTVVKSELSVLKLISPTVVVAFGVPSTDACAIVALSKAPLSGRRSVKSERQPALVRHSREPTRRLFLVEF